MLTLSPAVRIYLATGTTDLRRSIDGLAALVRERFPLDPLSGHLFLFRNRRGDRLKILARIHQEMTFCSPPISSRFRAESSRFTECCTGRKERDRVSRGRLQPWQSEA